MCIYINTYTYIYVHIICVYIYIQTLNQPPQPHSAGHKCDYAAQGYRQRTYTDSIPWISWIMICTVEACLDTLKFDQYLLWFPPIWLVVSTPLKNYCSQLGWLFPIYGKIKNVPNHQPAIMLGTMLPLATLGMQTHPGLQEFPIDINHLQRRWRRWSDSHQPVGKLLQIIPNSCFHGGFLKTWRVFPSHHPYVWWIFHEINHPAIGNHPCFRNPPILKSDLGVERHSTFCLLMTSWPREPRLPSLYI